MRSRFSFLLALACSMLAQEPQSPNPPQPPPTGKGSIEGAVLNDLTREPIRKADVVLSGPTQMRTITDQTGRFVFRGLPPGAFTLIVQRAGFGSMQPYRPVLHQFTLAADEKKTGVEIA